MRRCFALAVTLVVLGGPAAAEIELGFYLGAQSAPHSRVEGNDPGGVGAFSFLAEWEGKSFSPPPYYGLRGTWWRDGGRLGFGLEFTHSKVYATNATLAASGFSRLELTNGVNVLTGNVMYRWDAPDRNWTPYAGAGFGMAIPHVEVSSAGGVTYEYQVTGPAARWVLGVSRDLSERWKLFGEYNGTYSMHDADLSNGGTLKTDLVTNAVNVGVAFRF